MSRLRSGIWASKSRQEEPRWQSETSLSSNWNRLVGPLKPQQWLWLLKSNSLLGLLYQLELVMTTKLYLQGLDILVQKSVRGWLKLPQDCPISYFHADVKDGGLGISCMQCDLPEKICKQQCSEDPIDAKTAAAQGFINWLRKWSEPIFLDRNARNLGKQLKRLS